MASCNIVFRDEPDDKVDVVVEFDPPLDNPLKGHVPTPAQVMGWEFSKVVMESFGVAEPGEEEEEEEENG
jgi:hypothetical protein